MTCTRVGAGNAREWRGSRARTLLPCAALLIAAVGCQKRPAPSWRGHNVVWVSFDSVRGDHCSFNGYGRDTTPRLAELARGGVNFSHAVAQAPYTLPSYASMLTSRYVTELGVREHRAAGSQKVLAVAPSIGPEDVTLAQLLQRQGYRTGAFVQSWLSQPLGFDRGFDHFRFKLESLREKLGAVTEWIDAQGETPFFAFVYSTDTHYPFLHAHEPSHRYGRHGSDFNFTLESILKVRAGELAPSAADLASAMALYDEGIHRNDDELGKLIDHMERRGLLQRTIFVFNADHGQEFGEHGVISHGQTYYQSVVRTPLLIHAAGLAAPGRTVSDTVENVDIVPTLVDMLELRPPDRPLSGESLRPYLEDRRHRPAQPPTAYSAGAWSFWLGSVQRGSQKLVWIAPRQAQLFDLARDGEERHDLAPAQPALAGELEALLLANLRQSASAVAEARARGLSYETWLEQVLATHGVKEGSETLDHLKSLGYVQ